MAGKVMQIAAVPRAAEATTPVWRMGTSRSPGARAALLALAVLVSGCSALTGQIDAALPGAPIETREITVASVPAEPVCEQCSELRSEIARLRRELITRDSEIRDLRSRHREQARSLVVVERSAAGVKAKMRRRATRADAAALIADVEVAVMQGRAASAGKPLDPLVGTAERLLASSSKAFSRGDYAAAFELADQAWNTVTVALDPRADAGAGKAPGEVALESPVAASVRSDAVLRQKPGRKAAVVGYVKEDSVVVVRARRQDWTRVSTADGRWGWIYAANLGAR